MVVAGLGAATVLAVMRLMGPMPLSISSTVSQKAGLFMSHGEAEIEVVPDVAEVSLGINIQRNTVAQAQEEANQVTAAIFAQMKSLGIDDQDIKTSNYSIFPNYDYSSGSNRINGYAVNSTLTVKVKDFDKLNSVIDLATANGANQVGGIQFTLSEDKEKELKKQARQEAIEDAQASAEELARLSGVRLGKVVDVTESQVGGGPVPMLGRAEMMVAKDAAQPATPTTVEPGSTTYQYSVTLSYETF